MNPKKTSCRFYQKSSPIPIPEWLDKLIDEPWNPSASLQLDRWIHYIELEFQISGGERDA